MATPGEMLNGLRDRLDARLERVFHVRAVVPRRLVGDVTGAADQLAGRIVVDPRRARAAASCRMPRLRNALRLRQPRAVVELPRHAGAAHEAEVVAEAFTDLHDRRLQALLAVFPADRRLRRILIGGDAGRFRSRGEAVDAQVAEEPEVRVDADDAIEVGAVAGRLARQDDGADVGAAEQIAPHPRDGVVVARPARHPPCSASSSGRA